jgi:hypothetical protein
MANASFRDHVAMPVPECGQLPTRIEHRDRIHPIISMLNQQLRSTLFA